MPAVAIEGSWEPFLGFIGFRLASLCPPGDSFDCRKEITVNKAHRVMLLLALSAVVLLLAGCPQHRTISEINRDPSYFANTEVVVTGTVRHSYGLLGQGVFEFDDGSASLWVASENQGVPSDGAEEGRQGAASPIAHLR